MRNAIVLVFSLLGLLSLSIAETNKLSRRDVAILADMLKGGNGYGQKLNDREIRTPWT